MKRSSLAIVAKLDDVSARRIKTLWTRLAEEGHEDTPARIGVAPHVTLALFDHSMEAEAAGRALLASFDGQGVIDLTFTALGVFPAHREDYYFLAPAASEALLGLHGAIHEGLEEAGLSAKAQTRVGRWTPHCSLSEGVRENRAGEVLALLQDDWEPLAARLDRLALIAFPPAEELAGTAL